MTEAMIEKRGIGVSGVFLGPEEFQHPVILPYLLEEDLGKSEAVINNKKTQKLEILTPDMIGAGVSGNVETNGDTIDGENIRYYCEQNLAREIGEEQNLDPSLLKISSLFFKLCEAEQVKGGEKTIFDVWMFYVLLTFSQVKYMEERTLKKSDGEKKLKVVHRQGLESFFRRNENFFRPTARPAVQYLFTNSYFSELQFNNIKNK